jgi:glycosyltransferase involved in cell wall biosynthesis
VKERAGHVPSGRVASPATVVMTTRYPLDHPGGVERVAHALIGRLAAEAGGGWRATHVAAYPGRVGSARVPLLGDLVAAARLTFLTARRADVILVHGAEYAWGPLLVARVTHRPIVVVWHGVRAFEAVPPATGPLDRLAQRLFFWGSDRLQRMALRADAAIVVSPIAAAEVRSHFGFEGQLQVIPNGVDRRNGAVTVEISPPNGGVNGAAVAAGLRVIWIGTAPYKKGLDLALAACAEARAQGEDLTLTVVGVSRERSGTGSGPLAPWISWRGAIPPAEVDELLALHDVLLGPTRYEPCGMTILEALAAGLPVVGSKVVEWMIEGAGEVVATDDPADYSQALRRVADPDYRRRLAEAARKRAQAFSWEQAVASYASVLAAVSDRSEGHRTAERPT